MAKSHLKIKAFTLSEVLLVLSVIGVIAALTIPSLINNINNATSIAQLKKVYSTLQQAFILVQTDNGGSIIPVFQNDTTTNYGNGSAMNTFLTKMNYIKNCGNAMGCWHNSNVYNLNRAVNVSSWDTTSNGSFEKAVLSDGTFMLIWVMSTNCTFNQGTGPLNNAVCARLEVDLNGPNGPNIRGRDHFLFWITQTGIYPWGIYNDGYYCNVSPGDATNSVGCSSKIIQEGAMNY